MNFYIPTLILHVTLPPFHKASSKASRLSIMKRKKQHQSNYIWSFSIYIFTCFIIELRFNTDMYIHTRARGHVKLAHIYIYIYICIHVYIHIFICTYVYRYVCKYICMYMYTLVHAHTHARTHTHAHHTHTHTHIHRLEVSKDSSASCAKREVYFKCKYFVPYGFTKWTDKFEKRLLGGLVIVATQWWLIYLNILFIKSKW